MASFVIFAFAVLSAAAAASTNFLIGVGRYDITGPAAEVNMVNADKKRDA